MGSTIPDDRSLYHFCARAGHFFGAGFLDGKKSRLRTIFARCGTSTEKKRSTRGVDGPASPTFPNWQEEKEKRQTRLVFFVGSFAVPPLFPSCCLFYNTTLTHPIVAVSALVSREVARAPFSPWMTRLPQPNSQRRQQQQQ
jgi:hypothetical protein